MNNLCVWVRENTNEMVVVLGDRELIFRTFGVVRESRGRYSFIGYRRMSPTEAYLGLIYWGVITDNKITLKVTK